jgi:hypothetical protein
MRGPTEKAATSIYSSTGTFTKCQAHAEETGEGDEAQIMMASRGPRPPRGPPPRFKAPQDVIDIPDFDDEAVEALGHENEDAAHWSESELLQFVSVNNVGERSARFRAAVRSEAF